MLCTFTAYSSSFLLGVLLSVLFQAFEASEAFDGPQRPSRSPENSILALCMEFELRSIKIPFLICWASALAFNPRIALCMTLNYVSNNVPFTAIWKGPANFGIRTCYANGRWYCCLILQSMQLPIFLEISQNWIWIHIFSKFKMQIMQMHKLHLSKILLCFWSTHASPWVVTIYNSDQQCCMGFCWLQIWHSKRTMQK